MAEAQEERRLPFFVYGTLCRGFANHKNVVEGYVSAIEEATLTAPGIALYHLPFGFPALVDGAHDGQPVEPLLAVAGPESGDTAGGAGGAGTPAASAPSVEVHGELVWVDEAQFAAALRDCDVLEGYSGPGAPGNMYERRVVSVRRAGDTAGDGDGDGATVVEAFAYFYLAALPEGAAVVSGPCDWRAYVRTRDLPDYEDPTPEDVQRVFAAFPDRPAPAPTPAPGAQ